VIDLRVFSTVLVLAMSACAGGSSWSAVESNTSDELRGVVSPAPGDAWAIGLKGAVVHFDGAGWRTSDPGITEYLRDIHAFAPNDVWIVGDAGVVLRWNGSQWTRLTVPTDHDLTSIWGSSASDVWVARSPGGTGRESKLLHFNGTTWESRDSAEDELIERVYGTAANDVWATEILSNRIQHWDGKNWTRMLVNGVGGGFLWNGFWGSGRNDVWLVARDTANEEAVFFHWDGTSWRRQTLADDVAATSCEGLWGSSPTDVWAACSFGRVLHYDGMSWRIDQQEDLSSPSLFGIAGNGADLWAVGTLGGILHRTR
jgi:hypothetical protein